MTSPPEDSTGRTLAGVDLVVAVCGGIAAYKTCTVVSSLAQLGAQVTVAMTRSATRFVTPLTFAALSGRPVLTTLFHDGYAETMAHISSTDRCRLLLVAPATANMIAKMATGLADDIVSTIAVSVASPTLLAPAMNDRMYAHPAVRENLETLTRRGVHFVGPGEGWLACRSVGPGRMAEPDDIVNAVVSLLSG